MYNTNIIIDPSGDIRLALFSQSTRSEMEWRDAESSSTNAGHDSETLSSPMFEINKPQPGRETTHLVVSSKILTIASPVFRTLLAGPFSEATAFAAYKRALAPNSIPDRDPAEKYYTLTLPADDPEAMTLLLRILHHHVVVEVPEPEMLEKLAFLCDKYLCVHVLRYAGSVWFREWRRGFNESLDAADVDMKEVMEEVARVLVFCYVVGLGEEFQEVAWLIVMHHVGPVWGEESMLKMLVDHPLLRRDVAAQIDRRRFEMCEAYHMAMMAPLDMASRWTTIDSGCFYAAKVVGCYVGQLEAQGLMLRDLEFSQRSFKSLVSSAEALETVEVSNSCNMPKCGCRWESRFLNIEQKLKDTADKLMSLKTSFICLECIKTKGTSRCEGLFGEHERGVSRVYPRSLAHFLGLGC
ncbi:hypothetical protein QBC34DRAFT_474667 [Podospora aff. communis PSN243]|uniref:BTB domain-containing protein n=1 Tax=Podospora aff. communis PSN243 TaxID=3040156 RepID=A0AAV9G8I0_9PEZI|nr:hypothetical protein QBC34DRAFT_474667 [Podospora aff. communis PSN243]